MALTFANCSPSTYNTRYSEEEEKRTEERERPREKKVYRFDNPPEIKNDEFLDKYQLLLNSGAPVDVAAKITIEIVKFLQTPYQYGGTSENGLDCSAFTQIVLSRGAGVNLPRSADEQFGEGYEVGFDELRFGDLVFFGEGRIKEADHVGIYLGSGYFAHAGLSTGVTVSSFDTSWFSERFIGARRVLSNFGQ